jgi:hypothetical protein
LGPLNGFDAFGRFGSPAHPATVMSDKMIEHTLLQYLILEKFLNDSHRKNTSTHLIDCYRLSASTQKLPHFHNIMLIDMTMSRQRQDAGRT